MGLNEINHQVFAVSSLSCWRRIVTAQSGFGSPIGYGVDTTGTGVGSRPDLVNGQTGNLSGSDRTFKRWINTDAFTIYTDAAKTNLFYGRFGTAPRTNAVRLPGLFNADFSANKRFSAGERRYFEFRTEIFNLLNHYNPDVATVDLNSGPRHLAPSAAACAAPPPASFNSAPSSCSESPDRARLPRVLL